jgi:hypothetical protein
VEAKGTMTGLVLELCGGFLALSTIAFLAMAWASKSTPDLTEEQGAKL